VTVGWPVEVTPDPAPGDAETVRATATGAGRTARQLASSAAALRSVAADEALWTGTAAGAFRERLGQLPRDLDRAAAALADVERALVAYAGSLVDAQARARSLAAQWPALASSGAGTGDWFVRVDDVAADLAAASRRAESVVRHAAASAPHDPGWLAQLAHTVDKAVGDFVKEHATAIKLALDVLTWVELGLMVVGLEPAAALLAVVNVGATLVLTHYGEASGSDVAVAVAGALVGPAAKRVMSEAVVSGAVAVAPAAPSAVARAVRSAQPVASSALQAVDGALMANGAVTAAVGIGGAVGSALRPPRREHPCSTVLAPGPLVRPVPGPSLALA
jgi:uncharacterized protein YukE